MHIKSVYDVFIPILPYECLNKNIYNYALVDIGCPYKIIKNKQIYNPFLHP
jgi:hypothetical protein